MRSLALLLTFSCTHQFTRNEWRNWNSECRYSKTVSCWVTQFVVSRSHAEHADDKLSDTKGYACLPFLKIIAGVRWFCAASFVLFILSSERKMLAGMTHSVYVCCERAYECDTVRVKSFVLRARLSIICTFQNCPHGRPTFRRLCSLAARPNVCVGSTNNETYAESSPAANWKGKYCFFEVILRFVVCEWLEFCWFRCPRFLLLWNDWVKVGIILRIPFRTTWQNSELTVAVVYFKMLPLFISAGRYGLWAVVLFMRRNVSL